MPTLLYLYQLHGDVLESREAARNSNGTSPRTEWPEALLLLIVGREKVSFWYYIARYRGYTIPTTRI